MNMKLNKCQVCNSENLSKYRYSNHLNKINITMVKHLLSTILLPLVKIITNKFYLLLKSKLIFSLLVYIYKCNSCGYGIL